jgi:predicted nucleic acid-binding protein
MKYVLDASVAVAAVRVREPFHADALRRCTPLFGGRDEIVVPALFDLEVTSALVRRGVAAASVERFFRRHLATRTLVPLGRRAAKAVRHVIALTRLRAADSMYVWVAAREGLSLVTADREVLQSASVAGVTALVP